MQVLTQRRGAAEEHIFDPEIHQNRWMNTNNLMKRWQGPSVVLIYS